VNTFGADCDCQRALSAFLERGAFRFVLAVRGVSPGDFHCALADDLETVVKVLSRSERLGAEAGAWVIDFDELHGFGSPVGERGVNSGRVASGDGEKGEERQDAWQSHTNLKVTVRGSACRVSGERKVLCKVL
jgi:hypothetical protein